MAVATLDVVGLLVLLVVASLGALALRRSRLRRRGGSVDCSLRLRTSVPHRGWALGIAVYAGEDLTWYRVFSLSPRPGRVLSRRGLSVVSRREPSPRERMALLPGSIVLALSDGGPTVEIGMTDAALTGFLSWLESAPPGSDWNNSSRFR